MEMRILFVTDQYKPAVNGIVTHLILLREELEKREHEVWIVAPNFGKKTEPEPHVLRLPSVVFPPRPVDRFTIPFNRNVEKQLADLHFDVVHNQLFLMGYLGSRLAKKQNLPNLTTLHTPFTQFVRWSFPYLLRYSLPSLNFLMRRYFRHYDLVLCPSARSADELLEAHIKAPVKVLHNGIKLDRFEKANSKLFYETFKVEKKRPIISWVGRVESGKNADLAVLAHKEVIKKVPDALLVIVGGGILLEKTRLLVQKERLEESVLFTNVQKSEIVASLNKAAQLFLFTSDTDNLPTVVIEAMACGIPIVALRDKAVLDLVEEGENGYFTTKDSHDIAKKTLEILTDSKKQKKLGEESHKKSLGFSVEKYTDTLLAIYEKLIAEHKKNRTISD